MILRACEGRYVVVGSAHFNGQMQRDHILNHDEESTVEDDLCRVREFLCMENPRLPCSKFQRANTRLRKKRATRLECHRVRLGSITSRNLYEVSTKRRETGCSGSILKRHRSSPMLISAIHYRGLDACCCDRPGKLALHNLPSQTYNNPYHRFDETLYVV